jgi:hypothetical protein
MSKMVVGMNSRPEITPHRIDCGFEKTTPNALAASRIQLSLCGAGFDRGSSTARIALTSRPRIPMPAQNVDQATPEAINGPTTNWPADPPAMPNICVAPISVAARDAGKLVVAMYTAPTSANTPPAPCMMRPTLAAALLPVAKRSAPIPTAAAPIGTTRRGPSRSIAAPATRLNGE